MRPARHDLVLVTGAGGFIGQRLCALLQAEGIRVRALLRHPRPGPWDEALVGDLEQGQLPGKLCQNVHTVFHLAGKAHAVSDWGDAGGSHHRIHVDGTQKILHLAMQEQVHGFVFFSSVKALGEGGEIPLAESREPAPTTPYGQAKLQAERAVLAAEGIAHRVILRPTMVYGPGGKGNLTRMVLAIDKGRFPPWPPGNNHRSMIHVDDVAEAALLSARHPAAHRQELTLADGRAYATRQIYLWILHALGKPVPNWYVPMFVLAGLASIGDGIGRWRKKRFIFDHDALEKLAGSSLYDAQRSRHLLGFAPRRSLDASMEEIVRSIRSGT
ncbi:MAG: NAD-dependent epimerase/dehydratase family protein [Magnetococcales bacterium]|nr:NAD-dependent epimerase/dehydratase family protein [Magnetococcales bacterium]